MNEARDENRNYWDQLTVDMALRREMRTFQNRVREMALGHEPRSQMIIAPHGCGKGFALEQAVRNAGKKPYVIDKVTHNVLPVMLTECSKSGLVGVIDDQDTLIQDIQCMEHVARATASKEDGFSGLGFARTMHRADSFKYDLVLGITSNIDPRDPAVVGKKVADVWKKLVRRIQIRKIEATEENRYHYTCYQIICENALRHRDIHPSIVNEVLEFLCRERHRIDDPSLGGVKNMIGARMRYPDHWRDDFVGRPLRDIPELGRIPKLVAADRQPKNLAPTESFKAIGAPVPSKIVIDKPKAETVAKNNASIPPKIVARERQAAPAPKLMLQKDEIVSEIEHDPTKRFRYQCVNSLGKTLTFDGYTNRYGADVGESILAVVEYDTEGADFAGHQVARRHENKISQERWLARLRQRRADIAHRWNIEALDLTRIA